MISLTIDASRVRRLIVSLQGLERFADRMEPVMQEVARVVVEDNRKGVLAGIQDDDTPMPPTTYRGSTTKRTNARSKDRFGTKLGHYTGPAKTLGKGAGKVRLPAAANNGNLTAAQYKQLTGPPLAPRGEHSRVITNLYTKVERHGNEWVVTKDWIGVVSNKGVPFLLGHFQGRGKLPKRDLRKVRQWGREEAKKRLVRWLEEQMRDIGR